MSQFNTIATNSEMNNLPIEDNTANNFNLNTYSNLNLVNNQKSMEEGSKGLTLGEKAKNLCGKNKEDFLYTNDPKQTIEACDNAIIEQPPTLLQIASGCITESDYNVYLDTPQGLVYTFYFKEKSNCCVRNSCCIPNMPFDMWANFVASSKVIEQNIENRYFSIERPCGCTGLCYCCDCIRPKMHVKYSKDGKYLGKIIDACSCCDNLLDIYDENEQLIYSIKTSCWQIGLLYGRNAETVAKIDFKIYDRNETLVGHIVKTPSPDDKMNQLSVFGAPGFHDASNNFIVNFPPGCSPEHKFLLLIAAIKIGYQFFTKNVSQCCTKVNHYCCNCLNCCFCLLKLWLRIL